jgi:hypothetical protein
LTTNKKEDRPQPLIASNMALEELHLNKVVEAFVGKAAKLMAN